jgi:hypothetical protein
MVVDKCHFTHYICGSVILPKPLQLGPPIGGEGVGHHKIMLHHNTLRVSCDVSLLVEPVPRPLKGVIS